MGNIYKAFPAMFMEELLVAGSDPLYKIERTSIFVDHNFVIPSLTIRPLQYSAVPGVAIIEFHGSVIRTYKWPYTYHHSDYIRKAICTADISDPEAVTKILTSVRRICYG